MRYKNDLIESFKATLKERGNSQIWFYDKYLKPKHGANFTYSAMNQQLGGFNRLSDKVKDAIKLYLNGE